MVARENGEVWADQGAIQSSIDGTLPIAQGPGQLGVPILEKGRVLTRSSWEFRFAVVRTDQAVGVVNVLFYW